MWKLRSQEFSIFTRAPLAPFWLLRLLNFRRPEQLINLEKISDQTFESKTGKLDKRSVFCIHLDLDIVEFSDGV